MRTAILAIYNRVTIRVGEGECTLLMLPIICASHAPGTRGIGSSHRLPHNFHTHAIFELQNTAVVHTPTQRGVTG